jgi:hypothetical protein
VTSLTIQLSLPRNYSRNARLPALQTGKVLCSDEVPVTGGSQFNGTVYADAERNQ